MHVTPPFGTAAQPIAALALIVASSHALALTQTDYEFDILRNGSPVGQHELRISRLGDETRVLALSNIRVTLLGFTLYRMRYRSEEVWDGQGLKVLAVDVDDDGQSSRIDGQRRGSHFHWMTADGSETSEPLPVYPSNHWNPSVIRASSVLNTLTGQSNRIEVTAAPGEKRLPLPDAANSSATAYQYRGELNLYSWYDRQGRWLGMRFKGRDGSNIEYVCRNCADATTM